MPKKTPKNAFFYYMQHFREEQKKLGVTFANMKELADAASPSWQKISPAAKAKYETMAKKERGGLDQKYTSHGVPLSVIENNKKTEKLAEEAERKDIRNIVKLKCFDQSILDENFYLMDVIELCQAGHDYLIGEFTIVQFNLRDGIKNSYHEYIKPTVIPLGFAHDVKLSQRMYGLDTLDENLAKDDFVPILANIIDYLKQNDRNMVILPPLFTLPDKVEVIQNFIWQLCNRAAEDDALFRVYKADLLLYSLANALRTSDTEGFPQESLATQQLHKDLFKYTPGLACAHHEAVDKSNECTSSRVKRWAYTIIDTCLPLVDITPLPGKHLPHDFDINGIISYREERRERALPSVAHSQASFDYGSSYNSSVNNDTHQELFTPITAHKKVPKEKRTFTPLRKPTTDYSQRIQLAPELTESNFPTLGSTGFGRGRGLVRSMDKMNISK